MTMTLTETAPVLLITQMEYAVGFSAEMASCYLFGFLQDVCRKRNAR